MSDDALIGWVTFLTGWLIGLLLASVVGLSINNGRWRDEAVAHGAAEYYLEGSEAKWRWKEEAK